MIGAKLKAVIAALPEARKIAAEKARAAGLAKAKLKAALQFNSLHAYHPDGRQEWMCPTCNKTHTRFREVSVWTGYQYPKCCEFPEGHKQYETYGYDRTHACHK